MSGALSLDDIVGLYAARGGLRYGEGVTQVEHAVQCAMLAEASHGAPALVVAALLHDVGHLLASEEQTDFAVDDRHDITGATLLAPLFGDAVRGMVALHVSAKRYLCFVEPGYAGALSAASRRSLALQGGAFDRAGAAAFERLPHWREAVALRRFDDMGKRDDSVIRAFDTYIPMMRALVDIAARA